DAGAAAAVRDAERLVQVEVADVGAELAGLGPAEQRVEVGAVHVDLAAGLVHQAADLGDGLLVDAVRGGVGDHDGGDRALVLGQLGAEVVQVDVAPVVAGDHGDPHAGHHRAGRVGAVRGAGDQADVAAGLAAAAVVAA